MARGGPSQAAAGNGSTGVDGSGTPQPLDLGSGREHGRPPIDGTPRPGQAVGRHSAPAAAAGSPATPPPLSSQAALLAQQLLLQQQQQAGGGASPHTRHSIHLGSGAGPPPPPPWQPPRSASLDRPRASPSPARSPLSAAQLLLAGSGASMPAQLPSGSQSMGAIMGLAAMDAAAAAAAALEPLPEAVVEVSPFSAIQGRALLRFLAALAAAACLPLGACRRLRRLQSRRQPYLPSIPPPPRRSCACLLVS
jgi:hypothetical protein